MTKAGPVTLALFGAGMRGDLDLGYHISNLARELRFSAVAEPDPVRRAEFARRFRIPRENTFASWQELLARPRMADAVVNALPCVYHYESTKAALRAGYHVFLEKPMAHTPGQCLDLVRTAREQERVLLVGLENRYSPINQEIYSHIHRGALGKLLNISCIEDIGYYHFTMSYVRGGHASAADDNSFMIAKGIHDIDLIRWWAQAEPARVSSFGDLSFFTAENAPPGAPERCTDDCPHRDSCPFDALRHYVDPGQPEIPVRLLTNMSAACIKDYLKNPRFRTFASCISRDTSREAVLTLLRSSDQGRCVFHSDNGVTDHQTTSIEFENGVTCSYALSGFSLLWERTCTFNGSAAELQTADFSGRFELRNYLPARVKKRRIRYHGILHGGGDVPLLRAFAEKVRGGQPDPTTLPLAEDVVRSHITAMAVEKARKTRQVVELSDFYREAEEEARQLRNEQ